MFAKACQVNLKPYIVCPSKSFFDVRWLMIIFVIVWLPVCIYVILTSASSCWSYSRTSQILPLHVSIFSWHVAVLCKIMSSILVPRIQQKQHTQYLPTSGAQLVNVWPIKKNSSMYDSSTLCRVHSNKGCRPTWILREMLNHITGFALVIKGLTW